MKQDVEVDGHARRTAPKEGFVERMFRYWVKHHITMARYRIGHD